MDITMDMIEQVLDATGADYYTVKQTLLDNDGNVEEAIKTIKEMLKARKSEETPSDTADGPEAAGGYTADSKPEAEPLKDEDPIEELFSDEYADRMVDRLKERVKSGNVDRIRISRDGRTILDIPVNVGVIGGLFGLVTVPWAMILGVLTAYGLNCKIEIISSDGDVEDML